MFFISEFLRILKKIGYDECVDVDVKYILNYHWNVCLYKYQQVFKLFKIICSN